MTSKRMDDETYKMTQDLILQLGRQVQLLDLDGFLERWRLADNVGAILHPSEWMAARENFERIGELARKLNAFRHVAVKIAAEAKAGKESV